MTRNLILATLLLSSITVATAQTDTHRSTPRRAGTGSSSSTGSSSNETSSTTSVQNQSGSATTGLDAHDARNRRESSYIMFGLGYAKAGYPAADQVMIDRLNESPEVSNITAQVDAIGVYVPLQNHRAVVGVTVNGVIDRFEADREWAEVTLATVGASGMYFSERVGEGFFVRGDLGLAGGEIRDSGGFESESEIGIGALIGGGYAFPVSNETRMMIGANYAARSLESQTYTAAGVTVGVLF